MKLKVWQNKKIRYGLILPLGVIFLISLMFYTIGAYHFYKTDKQFLADQAEYEQARKAAEAKGVFVPEPFNAVDVENKLSFIERRKNHPFKIKNALINTLEAIFIGKQVIFR